MLGKRLKSLREKNGLSQEQLAKKLNLTKSSISMYENNFRIPNVELLIEISKLFNVSIDYMLDIKNNGNSMESELQEKEILKHLLIKNGYMNDGEELSDEELEKLMKFVVNNKDFIKNYK